ncbi:NAD(P)-binding Rossmann-fold superfamily protein [Prunus dulcis]|uniref:NAD(P)-binding Rossmann-fold superfamily protein n=1 Tax=Prunus dulcis TaxID=3755 RepID=A0A4Y1RKF2_PRUDU|nr:NAD(P)-binding Rossmann-fold superfamily protein [Prunus dulcis]
MGRPQKDKNAKIHCKFGRLKIPVARFATSKARSAVVLFKMGEAPQIAILGAGTFMRTQYIPRLAEISKLLLLKSIWSRTEESARGAVEIAQKHFPGVECKWGDKGLQEIIEDSSILGVAVVLAGQAQVDFSLRLLKAGKHVLQATSELETALSSYRSIFANIPDKPIWAVAENYRFEPAFIEGKKLVNDIGDVMSIQVIVEGSMNSSNPYFSSSWRRNFTGGFILDMGVHFVAGLRMLAGCEIVSVSAITSHVDKTLPAPDNIVWRFVGLKGTLQIERGNQDGRHGYLVLFYGSDGQRKSSFYQFSGVDEEFKAFINDISQANLRKGTGYEAEPRMSFLEGARDVAVLEAMLESGGKQGASVHVKKYH